jgi:carbonic anhydrase/acetyltransferase-like protein (isoleucine patch superfamily)
MRVSHRGGTPAVNPTAYVAPNVVLSGDVTVGAGCRVLYGAVLTDEGGPVTLGRGCIVMEGAVLRGTPGSPLSLGDNVLVGPHAYLSGCEVRDRAYIARGVTVLNGACIEADTELRINAIVHVNTRIPKGETVPISWVAIGDPATWYPPDRHDDIWALQRPLDFPHTVFRIDRDTEGMIEIMRKYADGLGRHADDELLS